MSFSLSLVALLFPIVSHHYVPTNEEAHYRQVNPGIIAEIAHDGATYEVGAYANSDHRTTVTVLRRFGYDTGYGIDFGLRLGGCTGYKAAPIIPCGGASIRLGQYVDVTIVPPVHIHGQQITPQVTALSFRMLL